LNIFAQQVLNSPKGKNLYVILFEKREQAQPLNQDEKLLKPLIAS
jgi:hypothetical protein